MERDAEEKAYRIYVTDGLRIAVENAAKAQGGGYIKERYVDIIIPHPVVDKPAEEIAAEVIAKAGITVVGGGEH